MAERPDAAFKTECCLNATIYCRRSNAQLRASPMLMMDATTELSVDSGEFGKDDIVGARDLSRRPGNRNSRG